MNVQYFYMTLAVIAMMIVATIVLGYTFEQRSKFYERQRHERMGNSISEGCGDNHNAILGLHPLHGNHVTDDKVSVVIPFRRRANDN